MRRFLAVALAAGTVAGFAGMTAQAQPFSPDDVGGLQLWLDATDINADGSDNNGTAGTPVTTWGDKTGNNTLSELTNAGTSAPVVSPNDIQGKDTVRFDSDLGSVLGQESALYSPGPPPKPGMTAFFAGTSTAGGDRWLQMGGDGSGNTASNVVYGLQSDSSWRFNGAGQVFEESSSMDTGQPLTAAFSIPTADPAPTAGQSRMFLNGVEQAVDPNAEGTTGGDTEIAYRGQAATLGAGWSSTDFEVNMAGSPDAFWSGDMGEVLVYEGKLSDSDRQAVTDYLQARWVPVPTPATLPMALMGLGALTLAGRRRRQAA